MVNRKHRLNRSALLLTAALALVSLQGQGAAAQSGPVVSVTGGQVQGVVTSGAASFKGIPYAKAPVGDLRWREPQPVAAWTGVRPAADYAATCAQRDARWNHNSVVKMSEDCLYLNVWTPRWPAPAQRLPVMMWIHGGGNEGGSSLGAGGIEPPFDAASLARKGVIVVTINYRLGILGFMAHPELTAESPHHASGNYALLDQVAALRWVHDNIGRFGGDPANVTVFGQSAGAEDTSHLLASPLTRGLIAKAIIESGAPMVTDRKLRPLAQSEQTGIALAAALKAPAAGAVKFLRSVPVDQLFPAAMTVKAGLADAGWDPNVGIDGYALTGDPRLTYRDGKQDRVPLIVGNTTLDLPGFRAAASPQAELDAAMSRAKAVYGAYPDLLARAETFYRSAAGSASPVYGTVDRQAAVDHQFRCTGATVARWQSRIAPTYEYEFSADFADHPAVHSSELDFVFGYPRAPGWSDNHRQLSDAMQRYWTNFARTGDPNGPGLPAWPRYDANARAYLELSNNGPQAKADLRSPVCSLYAEKLTRDLASLR